MGSHPVQAANQRAEPFWFEGLIDYVDGVSADWIVRKDCDLLRHLKASEKQKWITRARRERAQRKAQELFDEFVEVVEEYGGADSFVQQQLSAFPENLAGRCKLSPRERRRWIERAKAAAMHVDPSVQETVGSKIYFISTNDEFVKIGFTINLRSRLRSLRTASPNTLRIHLTIAGTRADERELHRRFAADHVLREWFRFSEDIRAFIDEHDKAP